MKVAVLGARGFVGKNIAKFLMKKHGVFFITRDILNLLDPLAVKKFLVDHKPDVVINCAAVMTDDNALHDARNNLGMFMNFYENSHLFGKFINTGSGAEFDRFTDIDCAPESRLFSVMPTDSYGWGQNIKSRLCFNKDNFYTIRIFNCFGRSELPTRIFPKLLSQGRLDISNDRYFDYFSIQDLCSVVEHCVENNWPVKDVNAVYMKKYKISEVVQKFCDLNSLNAEISVTSQAENNYTGNGTLLNVLGIDLMGLDHGLQNYLPKE